MTLTKEPPLSLPGILKMFRALGGFPIDMDPCDPTNMVKSDGIIVVRPLLMVLAFLIPFLINWIQLRSKFGKWMALGEMAEVMGVLREDVMMPVLFFCFNILFSLSFLVLFISKRRVIIKLYCHASALNGKIFFPTVQTVRGKGLMWASYIAYNYVFITGAALCYSSMMYHTFMEISNGSLSGLDWASIVASGISGSFIASPLTCSAIMMWIDILVFLADICVQWEFSLLMRQDKAKKNSSKEEAPFNWSQELHSQLLITKEFCELADFAHEALTPFILLTYIFFLTGGVMYSYGSLGFFVTTTNGTIPLLLCLGNMLLTSLFYASLWIGSFVGTHLKEKKNCIRRRLHHFLSCSYYDVDDRTKFETKELLSRLEGVKFSPYGYFEVCNSNFLTVMATNATYIIVLLQFKAACPGNIMPEYGDIRNITNY